MVKVFDIKTYEPQADDKFLFDTNVLILLFNSLNPDIGETRTEIYSDFLAKIYKSGSTVFLTSLNLSEFVNALLSREYNIKTKLNGSNYQKKRDFRNSSDYSSAIEEIKPIVKQMLRGFTKLSDSFEELLIEDMNEELKIDFNDEYFNYLCNYNDIKLVTDDVDYSILNSPLEIITGNKHLLTNK